MMTRQLWPKAAALRLWYVTCILTGCLFPAFPDVGAKPLDALLGLPPGNVAVDSSLAQLGKRLFFDTRLSADGSVSCSTCHLPQHSFADTRARSRGHQQIAGTRNAPSLLNVVHMKSLFWDGRTTSLEAQAQTPFINPVEHALPGHEQLLQIVRADQHYSAELSRLNPTGVTLDTVAAALTAFERTLLSGGSRFDRYFYGKEPSAMSEAAVRGLELFRGRANCTSCHIIGGDFTLFTDHAFHVAARGVPEKVGRNLPALAQRAATINGTHRSAELDQLIARDADFAALGRFLVTLDPADIGKFKTPSLRNVAETAPYMHDGGVATLQEAVDLELYSRGVITYPIILTRSEKTDLIEFLKALSGAEAGAP